MSGHCQHILLRSRRLKIWAALVAMLALAAWGIEYAAHLHVKPDAQTSTQASHFCEICSAFQSGASTVVVAPGIPRLQLDQVHTSVVVPEPRLQLVHSYRSRAPPHA